MEPYDVIIIGGGAVGTADTYALAKYSNLERIALVEKEPWWAQINSSSTSNSQSLHRGYYETNFSKEKTKKLKTDGGWVQGYLERRPDKQIGVKSGAMVLAVGEEEIATLKDRYSWAQDLFPDISYLSREEIARLEPNVIKGRSLDEQVAALHTPNGYTVDYGKLSASFVEDAKATGKTVDTYLGNEAREITRTEQGTYTLKVNGSTLEAKALIFSAGAHSLRFAQELGYGDEFVILPVAGNFFYTPGMLNGKVYTVQREGLPFAAVHGDPDLAAPGLTRFGPTAIVLPKMERKDWWVSSDYLDTIKDWPAAIRSVTNVLKDKRLRHFMIENLAFLGLGKEKHFLPYARKIIPTLTARDLTPAKDAHGDDIGGIRPQVVNTLTGELMMGEMKIQGASNSDKLIFNITPSPGASVCLANALRDGALLRELLPGYTFDEERFKKEHAPSL